MFIVVDGMDGAGKSTLIEMLDNYAAKELGVQKRALDHFPKRTSVVAAYLTKGSGITPLEFEMEMFMQKYHYSFTAETFKGSKENLLIVDRWVPSGIVYGIYNFVTKLNRDSVSAENFFEKLNSIMITPDLGFALVCDPKVSARRIDSRGAIELYETMPALKAVNKLFFEFCKRHPEYEMLETSKSTPQQVFEEIKPKIHDLFLA